MYLFNGVFVCLFAIHETKVRVFLHHLTTWESTEFTEPITAVYDRVVKDLSIAKNEVGIWKMKI